MIYVDDRQGSGSGPNDITKLLSKKKKIEYEKVRLEYGDVVFDGNGPNGPIKIGIEIKTIGDLVNSMITGRLVSKQLPELTEHCDFTFLLVVGETRENHGLLEERKNEFWFPVNYAGRNTTFSAYQSFLLALQVGFGCNLLYADDLVSSVDIIVNTYRWFNKDWEDHTTLHSIHEVPKPNKYATKPTLVEEMASRIRGVGWKTAREIGRVFPTPEDMILADEKTWQHIPGIGKVLASKIVKQLHEEE